MYVIFKKFSFSRCDGQCVQRKRTYSRRHSDSPLLVISASCRQVSADNPNLDCFYRLAQHCCFATYCSNQCNMWSAHNIRDMILVVIPITTIYIDNLLRKGIKYTNITMGLRSFQDLTLHLTTRTYDSHAPPFYLEDKFLVMVRFLGCCQIKTHVPLLVLSSVKSFNFNSFEFTYQVEYLSRKLQYTIKHSILSIHHLLLGLHGYRIHFATLAFELATSVYLQEIVFTFGFLANIITFRRYTSSSISFQYTLV